MIEAQLVGTNLHEADLTGATIRFVELELACLTNARLTNSDLSQSSLFGANLSGAVLKGAKLLNTDLRQANLEYTQLEAVDFTQCEVKGAVFTNAAGLTTLQRRWLRDNGALNI